MKKDPYKNQLLVIRPLHNISDKSRLFLHLPLSYNWQTGFLFTMNKDFSVNSWSVQVKLLCICLEIKLVVLKNGCRTVLNSTSRMNTQQTRQKIQTRESRIRDLDIVSGLCVISVCINYISVCIYYISVCIIYINVCINYVSVSTISAVSVSNYATKSVFHEWLLTNPGPPQMYLRC